MESSKIKTHRFKFNHDFALLIEEFSRVHKYDKPKDFKEAWNIWKEENEESINREYKYLTNKGYQGNIYDKIYKSARYYHKNKSVKETKETKRKQYVGLDRKLLELMDSHINVYLQIKDSKPSEGFNLFMKNINKTLLNIQVKELHDNGYKTKEDILNKFKKTYKNRYFVKTKKMTK
tara:strand:+ start:2126 stop:2656 length:531 start_codon:yes stop_codon:yes gene_type:complete